MNPKKFKEPGYFWKKYEDPKGAHDSWFSLYCDMLKRGYTVTEAEEIALATTNREFPKNKKNPSAFAWQLAIKRLERQELAAIKAGNYAKASKLRVKIAKAYNKLSTAITRGDIYPKDLPFTRRWFGAKNPSQLSPKLRKKLRAGERLTRKEMAESIMFRRFHKSMAKKYAKNGKPRIATYEIVNVKQTLRVRSTLSEAIAKARQIDAELQPAFGTTVYNAAGKELWDSRDEKNPIAGISSLLFGSEYLRGRGKKKKKNPLLTIVPANPAQWGPGKDYQSQGPIKTTAQLKKIAGELLKSVVPGSRMADAANSALRSPDYFMARPSHQAELLDMWRTYKKNPRKSSKPIVCKGCGNVHFGLTHQCPECGYSQLRNPRKSSKYSPAARAFISKFMKREAKGKKITPKKRGQLLAIAMSKARKMMLKVPAKNARRMGGRKSGRMSTMMRPGKLRRAQRTSFLFRDTRRKEFKRFLKPRKGVIRRKQLDARLRKESRNPGGFSKIYSRLISIITDKGTFKPRVHTSIWGDRRNKNRMILKGERWTPKMDGARVRTIEAAGNTTAGVNPSQHYYHSFKSHPKLVKTSGGGVAVVGSRPMWTTKDAV